MKNLKLLTGLLGILRGLKWNYWNSHWMISGNPYYGDHLMFERFYAGVIDEQIDTLAEKIVAYDANILSNPTMREAFNAFLEKYEGDYPNDPFRRGLAMEEHCQMVLKSVYEKLKEDDELSLGMDDFLMATANERETVVYLLKQRTRRA